MTDLDQPVTKRDLLALATKRDLLELATKRDLFGFEVRFEGIDARFEGIYQRFDAIDGRFEAVDRRFEELHRHFDVAIESFKAEFHNLYDWTHATTSSLGARVGHLESNHGSRLLSLETRVTRLEKRRK